MDGLLDTVGLVSSALGIVSFGGSLFAEEPVARGAVVKVKTGRQATDDPGLVSPLLAEGGCRNLADSSCRAEKLAAHTHGIRCIRILVSCGR